MATSGASGSALVEDVEKIMAGLGLQEEDLDDVNYDEIEEPPEAARWIAIARV